MPPQQIVDTSNIDLNGESLFSKENILEVNPQNFEMQQLDGILWFDKEKRQIIGYKDVTENEFWVRGHIPGRPIMPGVIMIECAAQVLSFFVKRIFEIDGFIGFAGIESAKFRAQVVPGQRLILQGQLDPPKSRKFTAYIQGYADGTMVFETKVSGMRV